jgi:hypothetical protein
MTPSPNMNNPLVPVTTDPQGAPSVPESIAGLEPGVAPARRSISVHTVLCLASVLVAGGSLYAMRQVGLGAGTALAVTTEKVELPKQRVDAATQRAVLADLNTSRATLQVPEDMVKLNPFRLSLAVPPRAQAVSVAVSGSSAPTEEELRRAAEARRREIEAQRQKVQTAFGALRFNSAIGTGDGALARINDRLYRVGDRVGEFFVIRAIGTHQVELEWEGQTFTLTLPESGRR